jgi:hypothetical protein
MKGEISELEARLLDELFSLMPESGEARIDRLRRLVEWERSLVRRREQGRDRKARWRARRSDGGSRLVSECQPETRLASVRYLEPAALKCEGDPIDGDDDHV